MIKPQDWADWVRSPVTQAVVQTLTEKNAEMQKTLATLTAESVEQYGIQHIAIRNYLAGLGEFLDLDGLKEACDMREEPAHED